MHNDTKIILEALKALKTRLIQHDRQFERIHTRLVEQDQKFTDLQVSIHLLRDDMNLVRKDVVIIKDKLEIHETKLQIGGDAIQKLQKAA